MPVGNRHEDIYPSYRAKCGTTIPQIGDCQSSIKTSGAYVFSKWVNITQVNNTGGCGTDCGCPDPATIPPYPRIDNPEGWSTCQGSSARPELCGAECNAPCQAWLISGFPSGIVTGNYPSGTVNIGYNYFQETTGFYDLRVCKPYGFKNVQAVKNWHGRYGFCYDDGQATFPLDPLNYSTCSGCSVYYPRPTVQWQTKYLTASATTYYIDTETIGGVTSTNSTATTTATVSIGRYNGVQTVGEFTTGDEVSNGYLANFDGSPVASAYGWYNAPIQGLLINNEGGGGVQYSGVETISDNGRIRNATITLGPDNGDYATYGAATVMTASMSVTDGGGSVTISQPYGNSFGDGGSSYISYSWDCTSFSFYTKNVDPSGDDIFGTFITSGTIELSNPYSANDVYNDTVSQLLTWDLTNDAQYPWRTDGNCTIAPLVQYNEAQTNKPSVSEALVWTVDSSGNAYAVIDLNSYIRDGSLKGTPLPNGFNNYFDWEHQTYQYCFIDGEGPSYYESYVGAQNGYNLTNDPSDMVCPMTASRWTSNVNGGYMPNNGAWMLYGMAPYGDALVVQKWAEILLPHPSQNFARPCGVDRYSLIESTVRCISGIAGTGIGATVTIDCTNPGDSDIQTNDIVIVNGDIQGAFYVSRTDINNFVLTALVFTGVDFNSIGLDEFPIDDNTMGKMRLVNAPALCGSVPVVSAIGSVSGEIVVTTSELNYLRAGDTIRLGVQNLGPSYIVSSKPDNYSFTLQGTSGQTGKYGTPTIYGGYNGGKQLCIGFVASPLSMPEQWNDSQPKGNFVYGTHTWDNRSVGQYNDSIAGSMSCGSSCYAPYPPVRVNQSNNGLGDNIGAMQVIQLCQPDRNCSPKVICISPNNEQFKNGQTMPFPSLALDTRYTSQWQARASQYRADYMWQVPHKPCDPRQGCDDFTDTDHPQPNSLQWVEDAGGSCQADYCTPNDVGLTIETDVYPMRGHVEDMVDFPSGISLPAVSGARFGYYSLEDLQSPITTFTKDIFQPCPILGWDGTASAQPIQYSASPWNIYFGQCSCTASNGSYAQLYEGRDGVDCSYVVPP